MGFPGATWRLREDRSHIDFLIPEKLQRRSVGIGDDGDGFRVLYEVPVRACADRELIKAWCEHLSDKVWAEGTIVEFQKIATKLLNGGKNDGKAAERKTGKA